MIGQSLMMSWPTVRKASIYLASFPLELAKPSSSEGLHARRICFSPLDSGASDGFYIAHGPDRLLISLRTPVSDQPRSKTGI